MMRVMICSQVYTCLFNHSVRLDSGMNVAQLSVVSCLSVVLLVCVCVCMSFENGANTEVLPSSLFSETYNETYEISEVPWGSETTSLQQYNRPQYMYTGGVPGLNESDLVALTYSGNRYELEILIDD